jgi:hypothetical protein
MPLPDVFRSSKRTEFKRTEFIELPVGTHIVRLLHDVPVVHDTHYIRFTTIKCLGEDCPICKNNRQIIMEHPKDFRDVPGYSSRRQLVYFNVLDRTPVKVCPNTECQKQVKRDGATFPTVCPKCGTSLQPVKALPLDRVKVISKGKEFYDILRGIEASTLDENETPPGITNYDLQFMIAKPKSAPIPSALAHNNDKVEVPEDALFDLNKAVIVLTPDEILDFMRGVDLRSIFAGRKAEPVATAAKELSAELQENIENIFGN